MFIIWVRNNFGFSRTESNAYLVLIGLLLVLHFWIRQTSLFSTEPDRPQYLDSLTKVLYPLKPVDTSTSYQQAFSKPLDTTKAESKQAFQVVRKPNVSFGNQTTKAADLNRVDSIWLRKIYGIGPVLSKRIIKYRDLLGGFHSINQLKEVYNLPEETIETLTRYVFIDLETSPVEKININTSAFQEIALHPYFTFTVARAIVSYRQQHGAYNSLEDLKKIHLMNDTTYLRVQPYVDF